MRFIARNLLRSCADLICLQEFSNEPGFLEQFQATHLEGQYPYRLEPRGNDPRGMNLAVLSKVPLLNSQSHANHAFPLLDNSRVSRFSRDLLALECQFQGETWRIFSTHLKSMRGGPSAHRQRESEAAAIVEILASSAKRTGRSPDCASQASQQLPWLLLGDLNDQPDSPTLRRFLEPPLQLCNSLEVAEATRKATFPCRGSRHQFDYILLPCWLANSLVDSRVWPESRASDHAMVTASFKF